MTIIGGIDEAGRGPVIGPLIIAGIAIHENKLKILKNLQVKDSKQLTPSKRTKIAFALRSVASCIILKEIPPAIIDSYTEKGKLNLLEAEFMAHIIKELYNVHTKIVYVDAPDINELRFKNTLLHILQNKYNINGIEIIAEHKADKKYLIVSAASIIAKVYRDSVIKRLHSTYGDFGSGYPSDPKTISYLKKVLSEGKLPPIIRKSWKTFKRLNSSLDT